MVALLKNIAEENRHCKQKHLFPDGTFCQSIVVRMQINHFLWNRCIRNNYVILPQEEIVKVWKRVNGRIAGKLEKEGWHMTEREYGRLVKEMSPASPMWKDCLSAFMIGGLICTLGQVFINCYGLLGLEKEAAGTAASMSLVVVSALLTGLSLYDNIAKHAGAGTLVPITGFANSIAAPAVEFKTEGMILGTAAKMFTIAGPVIVYGISASVVYGLIYWITTIF